MWELRLHGALLLKAEPRGLSEAIPVQTASAEQVASVAEIVAAIFAGGAVFVKLVFEVGFVATLTGYRGLEEQSGLSSGESR